MALALAGFGGFLTDAAFPGRGLWPAAVVGTALLVLALRRDDARDGALAGFVWGLAFFFPHLYWLYVSVGIVPWVALVVLESAFVAAAGAAWVWCRRSPLIGGFLAREVLVFATLWVVVEQARSVWPFGGFPWGRLAFSQTESPLVALASLGGAPLVSWVVAVCGALVAGAWVELRRVRLARAGAATAAAGVLVAAGLTVPLPRADDGDADAGLRVGAVQGNVARPGLDAFATRLEVLRNHVTGTYDLLDVVEPGELDVVLWPENASDVDPRVDPRVASMVDAAARGIGAPILVGTDRYDDAGRYNEAVLWEPGVGPTAVYAKQRPAPFAEYIPIRPVARLFSDKVDLVRTDMLPGERVGTIEVAVERLGRPVVLADVICFEVAYDGLVRDAVVAGGEMIVVQTNNASFGWTQESTQQLAMSRLRAVEHGRATVQISTVGVSGVILPDGSLVEQTELFTADQMIATVPLRTSITLADRLGDGPAWAATVLAVAALAAGVVAGTRRGARPDPGVRESVTATGGRP